MCALHNCPRQLQLRRRRRSGKLHSTSSLSSSRKLPSNGIYTDIVQSMRRHLRSWPSAVSGDTFVLNQQTNIHTHTHSTARTADRRDRSICLCCETLDVCHILHHTHSLTHSMCGLWCVVCLSCIKWRFWFFVCYDVHTDADAVARLSRLPGKRTKKNSDTRRTQRKQTLANGYATPA